MQAEFGDRLIHWENHCSSTDPFTTAETTARENWYGVSGYPTVYIDGSRSVVGAGDCNTAAAQYRNAINARLNETGGVSPVQITGSYIPGDGVFSVATTFKLVDNVSLSNLRGTILVYENDVLYQNRTWDVVTRKINDQTITFTGQGSEVPFNAEITINPAWNPDNLFVVAYLQQTSGNKQVIQGYRVPLVLDYQMAFVEPVRSVPGGNGTALFDAVLTNIGSASDTFTLELGDLFGSWSTDFFVCGDPNPHTTPVQVTLAPNEQCSIRVRVQTDGTKEIRTGTFRTTSAFSGRTQISEMTLFNLSNSILLVDNDGSGTSELPLVHALDANGYLHNGYNVYNVGGLFPTARDLAGYDIVIWETSRRTTGLLDDPAAATLMSYIDAGGALFLTSQYYLNTVAAQGTTFTHDYLGVASFTLDKGYATLSGVAGDVIGDGMTLPLNFQFPSFRRGDDAVPGPTAATDLLGNEGSHAMIRNEMRSGPKTVFMAEAFDGVSETDADPNNTKTLLGRVVEWLKPEQTMDVDPLESLLATRISSVRPNPFTPRTEISFSLSSAAAATPVRLDVYDASGRLIANLYEGTLPAGPHYIAWTGLSAGKIAESGVYFARLTTREGVRNAKMILLK